MNSELLIDRINKSGLKRERIATEMNISSESLRRKLMGASEFTAGEIGSISTLLGLKISDVAAIFFPSVLN